MPFPILSIPTCSAGLSCQRSSGVGHSSPTFATYKILSPLSPVFPTHHRPHSASSRHVPLPSNHLLPELFHHHQRVKIRALNPKGTRHHAVRLEAKLPVKLPATWIVDCDI